jgi:hypothetical protein
VLILLATDPPAAPLSAGDPAPEVEAIGWDGAPSTLGPLLAPRRGAVIVVAFLSGTRPSLAALPRLAALQRRTQSRGVVVLPIREQSPKTPASTGAAASHLRPSAPVVPVALVRPGRSAGLFSDAFLAYGVTATPQLFLIGRDGTLRVCQIPLTRLDAAVDALLKADETVH